MSRGNSQILHPDRAMRQAKTAAMSTLLRLIRQGTEELPEIYERSWTLWEKAKTKRETLSRARDPDRFVPVCDVEKHLRKNFLAVVFNTTALYGNTETKRVYSWHDGTIGPLNTLLNIAGARLRFLAMTRYPFPKPDRIEVRRVTKAEDEYFRWHSAYGGSKHRPTVIVTHPLLPSLDFVDAIRGHLVELCRQCFIHSVPASDASRYINLLIFRLRPLLDQFYMAGFDRKKRTVKFAERAETELDFVIGMVKGQHGTRAGFSIRVTRERGLEIDSTLDITELIDMVDDSRIKTTLKRLALKRRLIVDEDVAQLSHEMVKVASRVGTRAHERISWGTVKPFSAMSIMLSGDYLARDKTGYILAAEVPVYSGRGRADYALFVRKATGYVAEESSSSLGLWSPALVLDLKTKSSFSWGITGKTQDQQGSIVVDLRLKRRKLTDDEWEVSVKTTPSSYEKQQIESYAEGLLQEYRTLAREDSEPPASKLKGVILIDGSEFPTRVRRLLPRFIKAVYEQVRKDIWEMRARKPGSQLSYPRMLFEPIFRWSVKTRLAIVTFPFKVPKDGAIQNILPTPSTHSTLREPDPFETRNEDSRHFILYLTADSLISPGDSAGWIGQHWHGLQFAHKWAQEKGYERVAWVDLAGEFTNGLCRPSMLRLDFHHREIRQFYDDIRFIDLSPEIENALFSGGAVPSVDAIRERIKNYDLILVSGIDILRSIAPPGLEGLIDTLAIHAAEATSQPATCTIWFGTPSPLATGSKLYKRRQLRPFRFDSPLQSYIDEIAMNVPFPPRKGGSEVPRCDYARGLVSVTPDTKKGLDIGTIGIPPLIGWSKQFLSRELSDDEQIMKDKLRRRPPGTSRWLKTMVVPPFNEDMVMELFPFVRPWLQESKTSHTRKIDQNLESLRVKKTRLGKREGIAGYRGVLSRLTFSKDLCIPSSNKCHRVSKINARRKYRTARLELEPLRSISLPPRDTWLTYSGFSSREAEKIELIRLQEVRRLLLEFRSSSNPLIEHCNEFVRVLADAVKLPPMKTLHKISDFFKNSRYSNQIWHRLTWCRDWLDGWPMPAGMKQDLVTLQSKRKDILLFYGNYLIMMIASLTEQFTLYQTEIQALWDIVRPWVTMQMGARSRTGTRPYSKYDAASVYKQLWAKARYWNNTPSPATTALSNVRYGLRVDIKTPNPGSYRWYIFEEGPYDNRFITGCIKLDTEKWGPRSLLRASTVSSLDEIGALAEFEIKESEVRPIVITRHQGIDILYEADRQLHGRNELKHLTNSDLFDWHPVGMVRYGTRYRGALARLRYIKVITLGMRYPSIRGQKLPQRQSSLGETMLDYVRSIGALTSEVTRVKCTVAGTPDRGRISFKIHDGSIWMAVGQSVRYNELDEAARILRIPHDAGIAFQGNFTWDPLTDVIYGRGREKLKNAVLSRIQLDQEEGV